MILDLIGIALSFLFFASGLSMLCYGYQHYWNGRNSKIYCSHQEPKRFEQMTAEKMKGD